jgi:hypothetical protein
MSLISPFCWFGLLLFLQRLASSRWPVFEAVSRWFLWQVLAGLLAGPVAGAEFLLAADQRREVRIVLNSTLMMTIHKPVESSMPSISAGFKCRSAILSAARGPLLAAVEPQLVRGQ